MYKFHCFLNILLRYITRCVLIQVKTFGPYVALYVYSVCSLGLINTGHFLNVQLQCGQ